MFVKRLKSGHFDCAAEAPFCKGTLFQLSCVWIKVWTLDLSLNMSLSCGVLPPCAGGTEAADPTLAQCNLRSINLHRGC